MASNDNQAQVTRSFQENVYIMRHVPFPYFFVSRSRKIEMANAFAVRLSGYGLTELIHQPLSLLLEAYVVEQLLMMNAAHADDAFAIETILTTRDGSKLDAEVRVLVDYEDDAGVRGYHLFVHPVNPRRTPDNAEGQALRDELNARVTQQVEIMHDFINALKTPLSTLNTSVYLMQRAKDDEEWQRHCEMLHSRVVFMGKVLQDMDDYQHIIQHTPALSTKQVSLEQVLTDALSVVRAQIEGKGLRLTTRIPVIAAHIAGHQKMLTQLFLKVLDNAVTYTAAGWISLNTYIDWEQRLTHTLIQDSGCGILPDDLPHVCDRFYRGKNAEQHGGKGGGMGLALASKIVEQHHGTLYIDSKPEQGTSVLISLSLAELS